MNLKLIRHDESTANSENRWQGRVDYPLSEAGRLQAYRLQSRLQRENYTLTRIYSSPLSRALGTARIASSNWARPVELWDDLIEIDVGVISGLTDSEVEEQFPEFGLEFTASRDLDLVYGAETHVERTLRAQHVVDRLIREHDNTDMVLLFSHGGILAHIIARLLGTNRLWNLGARNTAVFEFSIDVDRWNMNGRTRANLNLWRINAFNDGCHLDENQS